jgi:flagellar assembly protein FliH
MAPEAIAETEDAADLVEEARRRADELIAEASTEIADVRAEGYRIGRESGYSDGMAAARAELADALMVVQAAALSAQRVRDQLLASTEHEIVELVIESVRTVIGTRVESDPTFVLQTVEHALQRLGNQNVVRLRVNPADLSVVASHLDTRGGAVQPFEVFGDGSIGIGGCIIDTAAGEIDARLDVQLEALTRALRTAVPNAA